MRLINAEPIEQVLFKLADKSLAKNPYENARICAFRRAFELILSAPTIAPQPNNPLTLEELRKMDGEPVWVVQISGKLRPFWMLVDAEDESAASRLYAAMFEDYGIEWFAYRHKPEEGSNGS